MPRLVYDLKVDKGGRRLRGWKYTGPCLVSFYGSALCSMVVGICAIYADVVKVPIAVGRWWVVVYAELVASSEYARVE